GVEEGHGGNLGRCLGVSDASQKRVDRDASKAGCRRSEASLTVRSQWFDTNSLQLISAHNKSPYAVGASPCFVTYSTRRFSSSLVGRRDSVARYSFSTAASGAVPAGTSCRTALGGSTRPEFISRSTCGMPAWYCVGSALPSSMPKKATNCSRGPRGW